MQKYQRIGDRVVGDVDVQTKLVVDKKPLVERPKAIANGEQYPERPALQRILYSVADGETGR
jgi:hypothetical protein